MAANTVIRIKRSSSVGIPSTGNTGELAYSYASNTLFIGNILGSGVYNVGGQYYTSTVDSATAANVAGTLVKRDASGNIAASLYGNANSASYLQAPQNFSISGTDITASAVSFGGQNGVTLNAALNSVPGLSAGTYGSGATIPVITVGANGRVLAISTAGSASSGSFNVSGNTGTVSFVTGNTFSVVGATGSGITTTAFAAVGSNANVVITTDSTILRSNTSTVGPQFITTDLTIVGNLYVQGTQSYSNVAISQQVDSLIELAANNTGGDVVDIGFYGLSNTNTSATNSNYYHGLIRAGAGGGASVAGNYYLFKNLSINPVSNTVTYAQLTAANTGNLQANLVNSTIYNANIVNLSSALPIGSGGTGSTSFASGQLIIGGSTLTSLANSSFSATGSGATNSTVTSLTVDTWGRLTAATYSTISGLTVSQGGTGQSTLPSGQILVGAGTNGISAIANLTPSVTGTLSTNATISSFTTDAYGRVSAYTAASIAISAAQVNSGILPTTYGGTGLGGATPFTNGGAVYATSTSALTTGTLPIASGGTNNTSYTNNTLTYYNGTGVVSLANISFSNTGISGTNSTITAVTVDNFGRATAVVYTPIAGLTVSQGGTGFATATTNGMVYGNGTGAMQVTAAAGTADQTYSNQILTVTNAGIPVWSTTLDGGTF
jgi:hypothetical protein